MNYYDKLIKYIGPIDFNKDIRKPKSREMVWLLSFFSAFKNNQIVTKFIIDEISYNFYLNIFPFHFFLHPLLFY